jgi:hypothetical protein
VDGRCIMGGTLHSAGMRGNRVASMDFPSVGCVAYPVYTLDMVPYVTNGKIAGSDFNLLATTKENSTRLLRNPF